jgi:hypothetical protein
MSDFIEELGKDIITTNTNVQKALTTSAPIIENVVHDTTTNINLPLDETINETINESKILLTKFALEHKLVHFLNQH